MKKVDKYVDGICDELHGAMCYAEKYIEYKNTNPQWARMYSEMANNELSHADNLKTIGEADITALSWISDDDKEKWEKCMTKFADKYALVKLMLSK